MKVSVIIPAYNAAATLAEAVTSVMHQTSTDWEVVIVNDGSSDDTLAIATAFGERDARIRVVSQANGGESAARNAGLSHARHEWILFLDADDWIAPVYLERLAAAVEADPSVDAIHCGCARVAQDGTELLEDYRPPAGDLFPVLARRAAFPVHACVVRRSLVESVGGFDVSLKKSPDWDLWQRIARCGARFGSVPEVLAYYRMTPNSASLDAEQMLIDGLTVLRRGHANDPRVTNPLPQYENGFAGSTVESQEYYLVSWCAGLLLGTGGDAPRLLLLVEGDRYTGLYPNAIAQCIFDAAALPSCRARQSWEELWLRIHEQAASYLTALESQSQTPGLAADSLRELKRLILKNSAVWGDVIKHEETTAAGLQDTIAKFVEGTAWLTTDRDEWRLRTHALERRTAQLAAETADLATALETAKGQAAAVSVTTERLQRELGEARSGAAALIAQNHELTSQFQTAATLRQNLERQHAEAVEKLAAAESRIESLEQREILDLELAGARGRIQGLEQQRAEADGKIAGAEQTIAGLEQCLNAMNVELAAAREGIWKLEQLRDSMEQQLAAAHRRIQDLEQQISHVSGELDKWRSSATARAGLVEDLQRDPWMRLGLWLRMTTRRECALATAEMSASPEVTSAVTPTADPATEARWNLRIADGNEANLTYPREDHQMVKIGISKAGTKTDWDIQLNRLGLTVARGTRYAVVFRARAARAREIGVGVAMAHDPWESLGMYNRVRLTPEWQTFEEEFAALEDDNDARVHFDLGGRSIGVDLTSVGLRTIEPAGGGDGSNSPAVSGRSQ